MRIVSYNVQGFRGYPPPEAEKELGTGLTEARIQHYRQVLGGLEADILCLQEGAAHGVVQRIARPLEMWLATIPSPGAWPGHVLSRYPIRETRIYSHMGPEAERAPFSRCFGACSIQVGKDLLLWVVNLHLHPSNPELREDEIELLCEEIPTFLSTANHTIIMGDFNTEIADPVHRSLYRFDLVNAVAHFGEVPSTFLTRDEAKAIDHIYVTPSLVPHLRRAEVIQSPEFAFGKDPNRSWVHSDHLPIVVELDEVSALATD